MLAKQIQFVSCLGAKIKTKKPGVNCRAAYDAQLVGFLAF